MQCSVCNVFQWRKSAWDGQRLHETLVPYTMYFNGIFSTELSCDVLWCPLQFRARQNVFDENFEKVCLRIIFYVHSSNFVVHCLWNIVTVIMTFQICCKLKSISRFPGFLIFQKWGCVLLSVYSDHTLVSCSSELHESYKPRITEL